jgi:hypothetical protein
MAGKPSPWENSPVPLPARPQGDLRDSPEVQRWLARDADGGVRLGRRTLWAMAGSFLLCLLLFWLLAHLLWVLSFAEVSTMRASRDRADPDWLRLAYRAKSNGQVCFRYRRGQGQAELWHRAAATEADKQQMLRWSLPGLKSGDVISVTSRQGWSLVTEDLTVGDVGAAPPVPAVHHFSGKVAPTAAATDLLAWRIKGDRVAWIGKYGGNVVSEKAVADGLDWLGRHQASDGSWSNHCLGAGPRSRCEKTAVCSDPGETFEMAHTGLALLAFQAGGHYYFNDAKYSSNVRRGLDWIVAHQGPHGELLGSKRSSQFTTYPKEHMYEHGIASFALADACAAATTLRQTTAGNYFNALRRAVDFTAKNQHRDGGWRYTDEASERGDTSVTGWQMLALTSATAAGVPTDARTIAKLRRFFDGQQTGEHGRTGYQNRLPQTDATTGMGMLARLLLGEGRHDRLVQEAAAYLADTAETTWKDPAAVTAGRDYYLWYNCTMAMAQAGGQAWQRWNRVVRDAVIALQRHDGCTRGSWDPRDPWGERGGRIYSTALAILTLEVYYRYTLPEEGLPP